MGGGKREEADSSFFGVMIIVVIMKLWCMQILTFDCLGLDQKILFSRLERLQAVTKHELNEVARRRLANLDDLDVVIVGDIQNASTYLNASSFFASRNWKSSRQLSIDLGNLPRTDVSVVQV